MADLEKDIPITPAVNKSQDTYKEVGKNLSAFDPLEQLFVQEYYPQVAQSDIDNEFILRYFARPANHTAVGEIYEISKQTYDRIKINHLYATVVMKWRIAGKLDDIPGPQNINTPTRLYTGVITANKLSLEAADKILPGMKQLITNPAQLYQTVT